MDLYEKIKECCKIKGISISQVESALGFSNGLISKWKTVSPTVAKLQQVADYLSVFTSYLIDDVNHENTVAENHQEEWKIFIRATEKLDEADLKAIFAAVDNYTRMKGSK